MPIKVKCIKNAAPAAMVHAIANTVVELPGDSTQGASKKPGESAAQSVGDTAAATKLKLVPPNGFGNVPIPSAHAIAASTEQSAVAAALKYAGRGLPVLLAQPNTKKSYPGDKVELAMLDPVAIRAAFKKHPDANVAVVLGGQSGVIALDVDVKNGKQGMQTLAVLQSTYGPFDTLSCTTPSGGQHFYFNHPGGNWPQKEILPGIDLFGPGKLMAPPSIVEGKVYQWSDEDKSIAVCPLWLADAVEWLTDGVLVKVVKVASASWNSTSSRHAAALALAGALVRRGWPLDKAILTIRLIHKLSGDDPNDLTNRVQAVVDTYTKFESNKNCATEAVEPLTGLPQLKEQLGEEVASALQKLLGSGKSLNLNSVNVDTTVVEEFNNRHAIVMVGGKACILNEDLDPISGHPSITLSSPADFKLRYGNKIVESATAHGSSKTKLAAEVWLANPERRQYDSIVFAPGGAAENVFNLFRGFPIQPIEGDCGLYLDHILKVICSDNALLYGYVLSWMAHAIQFPQTLPETALILRGKQGTGKNTFVDYFGQLFGQHYLPLNSMSQVTGRFNGHLKDSLLVHANEAIWGGAKDAEGPLKAMITDALLPVEHKGKDIITVGNFKRVIVSSNNAWAAPRDLDDRRYVPLDISDAHKEDHAYFKALHEQMNSGGLSALMHILSTRDLSDFNVRALPRNPFGFDLKVKSMRSVELWWFQYLTAADDADWRSEVEKGTLHDHYIEWCHTHKLGHPEPQPTFGKALKGLIPILSSGRKKMLYGVRPHIYRLPSLAQCREAFEEKCKAGKEIWELIL